MVKILNYILIQQKRILLCILIFFVCSEINLHAQKSDWIFEGALNYGRIVPHRDYFNAEVTENTQMIDLVIAKKLSGKKYWHDLLGNPISGLAITGTLFGDREIFGESIAVYPFIEFQKEIKKSALFFRLGAGMAYISEKYDEIENPDNNAISVKVNEITRLEFGWEQYLSKKLALKGALSLTHFSNTNFSQPNLGNNLIMGKLGLAYKFYNENPSYEKPILPAVDKKIKLRFELEYGMTTGWLSGRIPGRDLFHVGRFDVVASKSLSLKGAVLVGLHYEFDESIYVVLDKDDVSNSVGLTSKGFFTLGYEMFIGRTSLSLQVGTYFYNKEYEPVSFFKRDALLELLGVQVYLFDPHLHQKANPYLIFRIKAHAARAHHFAMGIGLSL